MRISRAIVLFFSDKPDHKGVLGIINRVILLVIASEAHKRVVFRAYLILTYTSMLIKMWIYIIVHFVTFVNN